eukprot:1142862-Pelagomonas_calceolata.AAC.1
MSFRAACHEVKAIKQDSWVNLVVLLLLQGPHGFRKPRTITPEPSVLAQHEVRPPPSIVNGAVPLKHLHISHDYRNTSPCSKLSLSAALHCLWYGHFKIDRPKKDRVTAYGAENCKQ